MKNIPDILRALTHREVQFVVVGGFAVQLLGFVRSTIDLALREAEPAGAVTDVLVRPVVDFEVLHAHAVPVELFGGEVKIASIDHLIAMKRVANRRKDLIDIDALQSIQRGEDPNA